MTDENKPTAESVLKKNIPDVLYPGVPIEEQRKMDRAEAPVLQGTKTEDCETQKKPLSPEEKNRLKKEAKLYIGMLFYLALLVVWQIINCSLAAKIAMLPQEFVGGKNLINEISCSEMFLLCNSLIFYPIAACIFIRFAFVKAPMKGNSWNWIVSAPPYYFAYKWFASEIGNRNLYICMVISFFATIYIFFYDKNVKVKSLRDFLSYSAQIFKEICNGSVDYISRRRKHKR